MSISLLPHAIFPALTDISLEYLRQQDVRLVMLDFDNTIVPYTTDIPTPEMARWLYALRASGLQVCVVSNSKKPRVVEFCRQYGLDCVTHARKPFPNGIRRCLQRYGIPAERSALIGDQIYTDVLGANCAGVCSILVSSIHNHTIWLQLRHVLEIPAIFCAKERKVQL